MTTWLIGEAPTRHTTEPFVGAAGQKLSRMAGFNVREAFRCTNVLESWPGASKAKGAQFPLGEARSGAQRLLREVRPGDWLIVVGGRCAHKAFRFKTYIQPYQWVTLGSGTRMPIPAGLMEVPVAMIPHPSGINQHWNEASNVDRLREFLQDARRRG